MLTAFLPAFGVVYALPDDLVVVFPNMSGSSREGAAAVRAFHHARECVLPREFLLAFPIDDSARCATPIEYSLNGHEILFRDNGFVMVLQIVLIFLSEVPEPSFGDWVDRERLPHKDVSAVFLVPEDPHDRGIMPSGSAAFRLEAELSAFFGNDGASSSFEVSTIDVADDFRLLFVDGHAFVFRVVIVAQATLETDELASFHLHLQPLLDVFGSVVDFLLGDRREDSQHQLAIHGKGVDVLFLEEDSHSSFLEHPDIMEGVDGVPSESGDGFGDDHVNLVVQAIVDHPHEIRPFVGFGSSGGFVGVDVHHGPFGVLGDVFPVI